MIDAELVGLIPALTRYARRLSRNDWDDLLQETLKRALEHKDQFVAGTDLRRWTFRIMYTANVDSHRRRHGEVNMTDALPEPFTFPGQEASLVLARLWAIIPPDQLRSLLAILTTPSYEQAARSVGIPLRTMHNRAVKARSLARKIGGYHENSDALW